MNSTDISSDLVGLKTRSNLYLKFYSLVDKVSLFHTSCSRRNDRLHKYVTLSDTVRHTPDIPLSKLYHVIKLYLNGDTEILYILYTYTKISSDARFFRISEEIFFNGTIAIDIAVRPKGCSNP